MGGRSYSDSQRNLLAEIHIAGKKNGKSAAITLHARLLPESLRFWNHKPGAGNWASEILICAWRPNASGLIQLVIPRASPFRRRRPLAGSTRPQYCCCGRDSTVRPRPSSVRGSPPRFDCRCVATCPPRVGSALCGPPAPSPTLEAYFRPGDTVAPRRRNCSTENTVVDDDDDKSNGTITQTGVQCVSS